MLPKITRMEKRTFPDQKDAVLLWGTRCRWTEEVVNSVDDSVGNSRHMYARHTWTYMRVSSGEVAKPRDRDALQGTPAFAEYCTGKIAWMTPVGSSLPLPQYVRPLS